MSETALFIEGRPVRLGSRVGKGGEGEVFVLADRPHEAVKLYSEPDARRREKIEAMISAGLAGSSDLVAFPLAVVHGRGGAFAGFTMRLVKGHKPLFELYAPGARKIAFPDADYRFLVRSAANVAVAVAKVHEAGAVVGDINHSGILISEQAVAALIDADSFQFGDRFLCRVGVPEYTPPELQGRKLDGVVRTSAHDAFGLAIVAFQLLFMGRHPFVGRHRSGDMPIEKAIGEHRFAYSLRGDSGMTPPPGAARLQDFPDEIRAMFESAFGRTASARPTATQWTAALRRLESSLSRCQRNALHYFPSAAGECVWCRMERESGIVLFVPPLPKGAAAPDPGRAAFDLAATWRAIQAVRMPTLDGLQPPTTLPALQPGPDVESSLGGVRKRRWQGIAILVVAAALLGWSAELWLLYLPLAWFGYRRTWHGRATAQPFLDRFTRASRSHETTIADWRRRTGVEELAARRRALEQSKAAYERLPGEEKRRLADASGRRREEQLRRHLEAFPLRRARIRGVGAGKLATLASYGIDTAAQVKRDRILAIPGFGPVNSQPLLDWRASVEGRFVYNPAPTPQDRQNEDRIRREIETEAAKLRRDLVAGAADLRATARVVEQRIAAPDPAVDRALLELEQSRIDLEALGIDPPVVAPLVSKGAHASASSLLRTQTSFPHSPSPSAKSLPSCPACGGTMVRRTARQGSRVGRSFFGCARYPNCRGTRSL